MKTVKIFTSQATPGMVVAEDVFTFNNQLVMSAGTTLTDSLITRMKFYSVNMITVAAPDDTASPFSQTTSGEPMLSDKIMATDEFQFYKAELNSAVSTLKNLLNDVIKSPSEDINQRAFLQIIQNLLSRSRNGIHVFDMLHCMRDLNDQIYAHSLNVSLICYVLGSWLNFSKTDLELLTLAGLLHDIGKIIIPPEIILKPSRLTDEEYNTVKTHTTRGHQILRGKNIDSRIKFAALMHHERCDGSGYPMGLRGDRIDSFAKIVAIADVYEAMTSARVYRNSLCPFEVIHLLEVEGKAEFDTHYLMCFLEHLNQTYINRDVRLSDKSEGKIVMMNRFALSRPVVKVGKKYVDLSTTSGLYIEALI